MNIDAFINNEVKAHNIIHPNFTVTKKNHLNFSWYFLYLKEYNTLGIEEIDFYRFLYENLSRERIYPRLVYREISGKPKIGIAFEVKDSL